MVTKRTSERRAAPPAASLDAKNGRTESDDEVENVLRLITVAKNSKHWERALHALTGQKNPQPLGELLRHERAPMFVQKTLANLLDPPFSPVAVRLALQRPRRGGGKLVTLGKQLFLGEEIESRIKDIEKKITNKKTGIVDSVVLEFEKAGRGRPFASA
jgi:hypothetical protein